MEPPDPKCMVPLALNYLLGSNTVDSGVKAGRLDSWFPSPYFPALALGIQWEFINGVDGQRQKGQQEFGLITDTKHWSGRTGS